MYSTCVVHVHVRTCYIFPVVIEPRPPHATEPVPSLYPHGLLCPLLLLILPLILNFSILHNKQRDHHQYCNTRREKSH